MQKILISGRRQYRYDPDFAGVTVSKRAGLDIPEGTFDARWLDLGRQVPAQPEAWPFQDQDSERYTLEHADLAWLAETMTAADGSRPELEGLCVGEGSFATSLHGHILRTVDAQQTYSSGRPTLPPELVDAFLALPGTVRPLTLEVSRSGGWAAIHTADGSASAYGWLKKECFPEYRHLIEHNHTWRQPWGRGERRVYAKPDRKSFITLQLKCQLLIDAGLLNGTPDGTLCYSRQKEVNHVMFVGNGPRKCVVSLTREGEKK